MLYIYVMYIFVYMYVYKYMYCLYMYVGIFIDSYLLVVKNNYAIFLITHDKA